MEKEIIHDFENRMSEKLGEKYELRWDTDRKGVVFGWCKLKDPSDILSVAELIADFKGRVMTISPLNTPAELTQNSPGESKTFDVAINYHFFFQGINLTVCITLQNDARTVKSITPVLISADWHEREMRELFNIKLQGHPNAKRLFLDEGIHMTDHTMIPLSEALNGASTSTLWEKIMSSGRTEAVDSEQL